MSRWGEDTTMKFVLAYRERECLWNITADAYKNKRAREAGYRELQEIMGIEGFGVAEVKSKIRNLRSTYSQEKRKIRESKMLEKGSDRVYVPNLKWFYEMDKFINDLDEVKRVIHENTYAKLTEENEIDIYIEEPSQVKPVFKKAKSARGGVQMKEVCPRPYSHHDEDLDIAKVWAAKLKCLTPQQKLFAEKAINDILFEAQLGTLHRNAVRINEPYTRMAVPVYDATSNDSVIKEDVN